MTCCSSFCLRSAVASAASISAVFWSRSSVENILSELVRMIGLRALGGSSPARLVEAGRLVSSRVVAGSSPVPPPASPGVLGRRREPGRTWFIPARADMAGLGGR